MQPESLSASMSNKKLEPLSATVERVTYHNPENGFCVLRVKVRGMADITTVVGSSAAVSAGEMIDCLGQWINDSKHGLQFKAEQLKVIPPRSIEGIEKYLGSGMVKGIGPHFAKKLVSAFGENVFTIIEQDPDSLLELPGIGVKRRDCIVSSWEEQKIIREIMVFLQSHGVGTLRAVRIYKTYGDQAIAIVKENPYRLALDINGIGFKSADQIAQCLGIANDSLMRSEAGIHHVLQGCTAEGNCAVFRDELIEEAEKILQVKSDIVEQALNNQLQAGFLLAEQIEEKQAVYLAPIYQAELSVSKHLKRIQGQSPPWGELDSKRAIEWVQKITTIQLSSQQQCAIEQALQSKLMIITGGPGVGKTTVVNSLLKILIAKKVRVTLCAPTGRAAKRLQQATGNSAKTIHRMLAYDGKTRSFKHNVNNPLSTDFIVVDEVSMLDIVLMNNLLKATPDHAALLLIGDIDQLPSVGPGTVLHDLIKSSVIPTIKLDKIFRQAAHSRIITNAHRINQGLLPIIDANSQQLSDFYFIPVEEGEDIVATLLQLVSKRIPNRFKLDSVDDIQVLTPMNRGQLGARSLNQVLQQHLNGSAEPKVTRFGISFAAGDKVIQQSNNYDKDVYNGDIGRVELVDPQEQELIINYEGRQVKYDFNELDEVALAYATTIHKSQGSEYPAVVIPIAMQHYMMLARNLVYTAVTRGKKLVVVVGQIKALSIAIKQFSVKRRLTHLCSRVQDIIS